MQARKANSAFLHHYWPSRRVQLNPFCPFAVSVFQRRNKPCHYNKRTPVAGPFCRGSQKRQPSCPCCPSPRRFLPGRLSPVEVCGGVYNVAPGYPTRDSPLFNAVRNCPTLSTTVRNCPRPFTAVHDYPRLSTAVQRYPRLSATVHDYPRLSTTIHGYPRLSNADSDCPTLSAALQRCPRLSTVVHGCPRLSTAVQRCPRLSMAVRRWSMSTFSHCCPKLCYIGQIDRSRDKSALSANLHFV